MMGIVVQTDPMTPEQMSDDISYDLRAVVAACLSFRGDRRPDANALSSAILNILQGQSGSLANNDDWGKVVGGFFNQLSLGGIFGSGPPVHDAPQHLPASSAGISAEESRSAGSASSGARTSPGVVRTPARSAGSAKQQPPEKRGLKWHSDMSLVDVKEITSRDFDKDFEPVLPSRKAASKFFILLLEIPGYVCCLYDQYSC